MDKVIGALREQFMADHKNVTVTYDPTGSGSGIEAVKNGTADIGLASRSLKDEEKADGLTETVIALDGIAVIVNAQSKVTDLTVEQIAKYLDIPREDVVMAMDAIVDPVSLYEPVYADGGGDAVCVMDQVRDDRNTDESWLDRIALKEAISRLDPRERSILALRFCQGKTQMEVSGEIGISQAQVSRLEKGAISAIRRNM